VYATTGARINMWLEIFVSPGDKQYFMGEVVDPPGVNDAVEARIHVDSDGEDLSLVELMWYDPAANGGAGKWAACESWSISLSALNVDVDLDATCASTGEETIYYLRAVQENAIEDVFLVTAGTVDTILFEDAAENPYIAVLDPGWYTAAQLCTEIATEMNAEYSNGFACSYASHRFTISGTANFKLLWNNDYSTALSLLGFEDSIDQYSNSYGSDFDIWSDGWVSREMAWSSPIWLVWP
jgi:hypothetical protein